MTDTSQTPPSIAWRGVLRKGIPIVFYVLLVFFLGVYIHSVDWSQLEGISLAWSPLVAATVLSLLFRYLGVFIWLRLLHWLGGTGLRGQWRELAYIYAKSWLGRYIPGAATWILGKVFFASRRGISKARLAVSGVLEGALQVLATLVVGIALVFLDPRTRTLPTWIQWMMLAALAIGVITLIPPVFGRLISFAFRVTHRGTPDPAILPGWRAMGEATALYIAGALVTGSSYYLMAAAIYPEVKLSDAPYLIGAASLASAISMLAIFAPGGLGVREGTLGLLLAGVMPGPIALILVIVLRVWSVAVDFLFFIFTWIARDRQAHSHSEADLGVQP